MATLSFEGKTQPAIFSAMADYLRSCGYELKLPAAITNTEPTPPSVTELAQSTREHENTDEPEEGRAVDEDGRIGKPKRGRPPGASSKKIQPVEITATSPTIDAERRYTKDEVAQRLRELATKRNTQAALDALHKFKVERISQITEDKYPAFMEHMATRLAEMGA